MPGPLVCTLGGSWSVIPEAYALLDPVRCPLYCDHPRRDQLEELRARYELVRPDALWVVTTSATTEGVGRLQSWWSLVRGTPRIRFLVAAAPDGDEQASVELIRELIFRACLHAGPDAVLSLGGGRKTMSADLQRAGGTFGARCMLHVIAEPVHEWFRSDEGRPGAVVDRDPALLSRHLPRGVAATIQPVVVGKGRASDVLGIKPALEALAFPLPPEDHDFIGPGAEGWLWKEVESRERDSTQLLANFRTELATVERHANWRGL